MSMHYNRSGSEIQAAGLYLMSPSNYIGQSDTSHQQPTRRHPPTAAVPATHSPPNQFAGIPISFEEIPPHFGYNIMAENLEPSMSQQTSRGLSLSLIGMIDATNGNNSAIMGSKYLKAAKELLDEVACVGKGVIKNDRAELSKGKAKKIEGSVDLRTGISSAGAELTIAQKHEIQTKKAKLHSMLDEVEQRYRQYNHQMQSIAISFEEAAGIGSAESYTSLALNAISKHFRCLKDVISKQIRALSKILGNEECSGDKLKFVDHHRLQQHKTLQQLGIMQNHSWRPQRGLPERAVSVLRAWLFEHFLHPYPKDSDKQMLAKQSGLTRSQVSNWFINARVRLWKPMVEEMYLDEIKNKQDHANPPENAPKIDHLEPPSPPEISASTVIISPTILDNNPKKTRLNHMHETQKNSPNTCINIGSSNDETETRDPSKGFEFNEFSSFSNNVSLTLALPPFQSSSPLISNRRSFGGVLHESNNGSIDYGQILDFQNRKVFPAQFFPDFVA